MPRMNIAMVAVLALALFAAPSCGGGGHGFRVNADPLQISTTVLPLLLSGDAVDVEIELTGGCNGPYVVSVISGGVNGGLPPGVGVENRLTPNAGPDGLVGTADDGDGPDGINGTADDGMRYGAFITGILLADGTFNFTIQVTDSNCSPFLSITQSYTWSVGVGQVRIVASDPAFIPEASFADINKHEAATNPGTTEPIDALPTTVYNKFSSINLTVAGGFPPYSCAIIDDPNDPLDGDLPLGIVIPVSSCSLVGAPVQVLPGGIPFLLTVRVQDSTGATSVRKIQWKIDTPPIIVATTTLPDGKCGQSYGEPIQVADGVPPFDFELINALGEGDFEQHVYASPATPTFPTTPTVTVNPTGESNNLVTAADYPAPADAGPYTFASGDKGTPPEGMYLIDFGSSNGQMTGIPRRAGNFDVTVHVYSTLVPNERGQHGFGNYNFDIAPSEPPAGLVAPYGINGAFTSEGTLIASTPFSTLPEFSVDAPYDPDDATHSPDGLQLLGQGGVPFDGVTDAPHFSNVNSTPQEPTTAGWGYRWQIDQWHPVSGDPAPASAAIDLFPGPAGAPYSTGVLGSSDPTQLVRASRRLVQMTVSDDQLPTGITNSTTATFGYSVGPDLVIITQSSTSQTATTSSSTGNFHMMDSAKVVRKFENKNGTGSITVLDSDDLAATHDIPALAVGGAVGSATDLEDLLGGGNVSAPNLDFVRGIVNGAGWWDDIHSLHPDAARHGQHADYNRSGFNYYHPGYRSSGQFQSNVQAVALPNTPSVSHSPNTGVYNNGGRLYVFDNNDNFGIFIIRSDSRIYVPFATRKTTYRTFGDNMHVGRANQENSMMRSMQFAVTPDGRIGIAEIQTAFEGNSQHLNQASNSRLVIFSLTGEKLFSGETYKLVDPLPSGGLSGPSSSNEYLYSTSIVATNKYCYFLIGGFAQTYGSWRDHYVLRYELEGTAAQAELVPGLGQSSTTPVQTPFHQWDSTMVSSTTTFSSSGTAFITVTDDDTFLYDGTNFLENLQAPIPFRVSKNGMAVAILAGPRTASTSGTEVMRHQLHIDYDGVGARQASSSSQYHYAPSGAQRGSSLSRGPSSYRHWGRYTGPSSTLEISDDGLHAAFVGFSGSDSISSTSSAEGKWLSNTCEIFCFSAGSAGADPWATVDLPPASTNGNLTGNLFAGTQNWRFGALGFTADNNALTFWAGVPSRSPTSTSSAEVTSDMFEGAFYIYDLTSTVSKKMKSMQSRADGGSLDGIKAYTNTTPVNITNVTSWGGAAGYMMPLGGFYSQNRNFLYIVDHTAHDSTGSPSTLFGFNVSAYTANTINGKIAGQGFEVDNFGTRRPFLRQYYYQARYALDLGYFHPKGAHGYSMQVVAKDTGWVFWASQYATSNPQNQTAPPTFGTAEGPALATAWNGYQSGGEIWGFNPNVAGPATELTHVGLGTDTSLRAIHFLEVNSKGTQVSYVWDDNSSQARHDYEYVGHIYDIGFDPVTGALIPSYVNATNSRVLESTRGRASEGMAHDSSGTRLYYAYKSGTGGNENQKGLVEASRDPATGVITIRRFFNTGTDRKWFDVLHAGR